MCRPPIRPGVYYLAFRLLVAGDELPANDFAWSNYNVTFDRQGQVSSPQLFGSPRGPGPPPGALWRAGRCGPRWLPVPRGPAGFAVQPRTGEGGALLRPLGPTRAQ